MIRQYEFPVSIKRQSDDGDAAERFIREVSKMYGIPREFLIGGTGYSLMSVAYDIHKSKLEEIKQCFWKTRII